MGSYLILAGAVLSMLLDCDKEMTVAVLAIGVIFKAMEI